MTEAYPLQDIWRSRLSGIHAMAGAMTHEISQPLCGIRGYAEGLLIGLEEGLQVSEDEVQRALQVIVEQTERIDDLLMQVRGFADEDQRQHYAAYDICDIIDEVLGLLRSRLSARNILIHEDRAYKGARVWVSRYDLTEVLQHILMNAAEAMPESRNGSSENSIEILLDKHSRLQGPRLVIRDNGCGMSAEAQCQATEPFFSTKHGSGNVGLGLSISQTLLRKNKAELLFRSRPEEGTVVEIHFPDCASGVHEE